MIREKIRKLLAVASDAGASDNERDIAMRKAQSLIEEHNIEIGTIQDASQIEISKGDFINAGPGKKFHRVCAHAAADLYECQVILTGRTPAHQRYSFWGLRYQIEAAEETFLWIIAQIEQLYRIELRTYQGRLDKKGRTELRETFKIAAALSVMNRVENLMKQRQVKRDSRALTVVSTVADLIEEELKNYNIKDAPQINIKQGLGTGAGYIAGNMVKFNKDLK